LLSHQLILLVSFNNLMLMCFLY